MKPLHEDSAQAAPELRNVPAQTPAPLPNRRGEIVAVLLALSAIALGQALEINNGFLSGLALLALSVALACCLGAHLVPRRVRRARKAGRRDALTEVLRYGLVLQFVELLVVGPNDRTDPLVPFLPFAVAVVAGALLTLLLFERPALMGRWGFAAILAVHFALGAWMIHGFDLTIDVHLYQQQSSAALLHGHNPYALTFPLLEQSEAQHYAPELVRDGRLQFGYPYLPLTLLMALPGYVLAGDHRYAQLAALTLSAALLAYARPGRLSFAAASLLLWTPRVFFLLTFGWTEPFAVLLLSATLFCACRRPRLVPLGLGLLLAVKQFMFLGAPAFLLLPSLRRRPLRTLTGALICASCITLPMVFWDFGAFLHSAVTLQIKQPFRPDALSYAAWIFKYNRWQPPIWIAFGAVIAASALVLKRGARTPMGFASGTALIFFAFFVFNKQAFANYYIFVLGALCCALAVARPEESAPLPSSRSLP